MPSLGASRRLTGHHTFADDRFQGEDRDTSRQRHEARALVAAQLRLSAHLRFEEVRDAHRSGEARPCGRRQRQTNISGSDELEKSVPIVLNTAPERQVTPSLARDHDGQVRIANLNTLHQGLVDAQRSESIGRLLRAAQADIYCFQEEFEEATFRRAAPKVVPTSDSQHVNLHWSGDCGIATSLPLEPIPMELARGVAALIELPDHKHVAVISVHFKCCGYTGSWQDEARVYQAQRLAENIAGLRKGEFGDKCKKAGIVVIGDYNLVGSRKPLDILTSTL